MDRLELQFHRYRRAAYRQLSIQTPIHIASVFSSDMVLQRDIQVPIWGTATPHEKITVTFNGQIRTTVVDSNGNWSVKLAPMPANALGQALIVKSLFHSVVLNNVVVGEVWVCSGQSNMGWTLDLSADAEKNIASATNPHIRFLPVPSARSSKIETQLPPCKWAASHPEHACNWSAVGFHFATKLFAELDVPIGIIWSALGATKIQEWTSREVNQLHPYEVPEEWNNNEPSSLFNKMIAPLIPYAIRGVAWYQGEENHWGAGLYETQQSAMIEDWRERWGQGSFPFVYVQLANFGQTHSQPWSAWAELQEAQLHSLSHPNTAMAVAIDVGEADDIHPRRKQPVGERLAIAALGKFYDKCEVYSGPLFQSFQVEGNKIRVFFDHAGEGLKSTDGLPLRWFEIGEANPVHGKNATFLPAIAEIEGNSVLLYNDSIDHPVAARYAFNNNPEGCNLTNSAGLPASPFRTSKDWSATLGNDPKRPIKQVPVATHQRISTEKNATTEIHLHGRWSQNAKPLYEVYDIIEQPTLGTLKGLPPYLLYESNGHIGTDKFTYRLRDEAATSNVATIIIDVQENTTLNFQPLNTEELVTA